MSLPRAFAFVTFSAVLAGCDGFEPAAMTDTAGEPIAGLTDAERGRFLLGRALFERLATPEEGLGPLFNGERCSTCHDEPATGGGTTRVFVLKATAWNDGRCSSLADYGGDNIQLRATPLLHAEGIGPEEVPAQASATRLFTAPPLFGLGLLEAVPDEALLANADPADADGDGISGSVARFGDGSVARFGRKGDARTVAEFVESALRFELGFTTEAHPREEARNGVALPARVDPMPDPEIDGRTLGLLVDYVRLLAPPAPAPLSGAAADSARRGGAIFEAVGCNGCHVPSLHTAKAREEALSEKRIAPYTDLLLHDLGGAEGDVCTAQAAPGEYRTAPLWGLRHRTRYLHDGSAGTLEQAIGAHGGEAERVTSAFRELTAVERALLLRFLSSL